VVFVDGLLKRLALPMIYDRGSVADVLPLLLPYHAAVLLETDSTDLSGYGNRLGIFVVTEEVPVSSNLGLALFDDGFQGDLVQSHFAVADACSQ
jgi:hypothetical protein